LVEVNFTAGLFSKSCVLILVFEVSPEGPLSALPGVPIRLESAYQVLISLLRLPGLLMAIALETSVLTTAIILRGLVVGLGVEVSVRMSLFAVVRLMEGWPLR
jgi:hypothetical protein